MKHNMILGFQVLDQLKNVLMNSKGQYYDNQSRCFMIHDQV